MIKNICKDTMFLSQKAEPATKADTAAARDLLDTLNAHPDDCVGMAANMIGVNKAIIAVNVGFTNIIMYNPVILKKKGAFDAEEGCLSLEGERRAKRYSEIEVEYEDADWNKRRQKFTGWTAQIIQHECDHLAGILI